MSKSYPEITKALSAGLRELRKEAGDTMAGFSTMTQAAMKDGAVSKKTKEFIALALGVAARCDGCVCCVAAIRRSRWSGAGSRIPACSIVCARRHCALLHGQGAGAWHDACFTSRFNQRRG